ncbi:MAG: hypothetical protein GY888_26595, partial [Planctomycetaceae bacterium]|nr:hypothetical protein [Planctomycetaceae bacterium]
MRLLALFLVITISVSIGCNTSTETSTPEPGSSGTTDETQGTEEKDETPAEHPAITVANQVLAAIQAGDAAAIRPLLNATNQKKVSDDDIVGLLKEVKETIGDVTQVTEVRKRQREGEVAAKIRVRGEEVLVVVLTLEEGQYRFED